MFKTTLIAAIALAGAQAIKISSQATSETSVEALSSYPGMHSALTVVAPSGSEWAGHEFIITRDVDMESGCDFVGFLEDC